MATLLGENIVADTDEAGNFANPNEMMSHNYFALETGNVETATINLKSSGVDCILMVTDVDGYVLCTGNIPSTVDGDNTVALLPAVELVQGTEYRLIIYTDDYLGGRGTGPADVLQRSIGLTYPVYPDPVETIASSSTTTTLRFFVTGSAVASGPTITGPDTATEGSATVATGTALDTVTNFSLISGSNSVVQSIDSATATTLNYVARSGVSLCTPSTSIAGLPLEPTISAAGITPYVVQQKADDGINPPATRNITLNGEATHEVIQTMTVPANTTVGESIFGTGLIVVENDMQAYVPKTANGMNITWAADGTFTTDADQTEVITVSYFSPSTGEWSCLSLTIKNSVIISATGISNRDDWVRSVLGKDGNTNDLWIEYWISQGATSGSFNDMAYSWLGSLGYTQSLVDRWFSWEEAELGR